MRNIKVHVKDINTLVLDEDAKAGDLISLSDIQKVDLSFISELINKEKQESYQKQINDRFIAKLEVIKAENENKLVSETNNLKDEIKNLENEIARLNDLHKSKLAELEISHKNAVLEATSALKNNVNELTVKLDNAAKNKELELKTLEENKNQERIILENDLRNQNKDNENRLNNQIKDLEHRINEINTNKSLELENKANTIKLEYSNEINRLNNLINNAKSDKELALLKLNQAHTEELIAKEESYHELEEKLQRITLQKSTLNVKMLGEELERWCNEEYLNYASCGFINCTWNKDNDSIKDEGEAKGTKADYIFRSYLDNNKTIELASVCCEMKNEALNSMNKKKNSDHFSKLDKDRQKKNCEYALLISELEWDSLNDAPIKKVNDYDKMYVVRPQYFITFLSLITSLANKYRDLLTKEASEKLNLKTSLELMDDFNKLKESYFDKPLNTLTTKMLQIQKASQEIEKQNAKITVASTEILESTIETIKAKIDTFEIKAKPLAKKLDKLN